MALVFKTTAISASATAICDWRTVNERLKQPTFATADSKLALVFNTTAGLDFAIADLKLANVIITLVYGCSVSGLKLVLNTNLISGELPDAVSAF